MILEKIGKHFFNTPFFKIIIYLYWILYILTKSRTKYSLSIIIIHYSIWNSRLAWREQCVYKFTETLCQSCRTYYRIFEWGVGELYLELKGWPSFDFSGVIIILISSLRWVSNFSQCVCEIVSHIIEPLTCWLEELESIHWFAFSVSLINLF